jgi:two-component system, NarL family, nitrate/nitrite response regulator NarL
MLRSKPPRTITVLAADSQPLFLDAVVRTVRQDSGLRLLGEALDGRTALDAIRRQKPDVALLDLALPELDGHRVLRAMTRDDVASRVVLIAGELDPGDAYRAVAAGAAGVLSKAVSAEQIRWAVRNAAAGGVWLCQDAQLGIAQEIRLRAPGERPLLSAREREVLGLVAEGLTAPIIGRRLHVAPSTVRTHIDHLYEKVGAKERAQLVAIAMRRGLLE